MLILKEYYKRLIKQNLLKSFIAGLIIGFLFTLLASILSWFLGFQYYWLSFICLPIVTLFATICFYFLHYKQTLKQMASQIDELGLEERVLTMTELKDDQSYIAKKQRDDTNKALEQIKPKFLKTIFSIAMIVILITVILLNGGMIAICALAANNVIDNGKDLIDYNEIKYYDVVYEIEGDGEIFGDIVQRIEEGKNTVPVVAIANDGFAFVGWYIALDGKSIYNGYILIEDKPVYTTTEVTENLTIFAVFIEIDEDNDEDGDEGGENGEQGDPGEPGSSNNNGENSGDSPNQGSSSGDYNNNDYIIDGKTDYGDYIGDASQNATEGAKGDSNLSGKGQGAIGGYFGNIGN